MSQITTVKELQDRVSFAGIDQDTRDALAFFSDEMQSVLPVILEKFYSHIGRWPKLSSMFKDPSRMAHAKQAQQEHWMKLFSARFDGEYYQSVRRIGMVHSKIGLEPTWYIGAYSFTLNHLYAHAARQFSNRFSPQKAQEKCAALLRALNQCAMIDMDLAISVYLDENKRSYEEKLHKLAGTFESKIGLIVEGVSSASAELEASSASLASMATQTSSNATTVAGATEEASANISAVSSATEEMSASISQVATLANDSFAASNQAVKETAQSVSMMQELKKAIDKVNEITALITTIAEQTNLLALNATIEAARAGDAGKGFAVVASEVKTLATQTAKATEDIRTQVAGILSKSEATVQSIERVHQVIDRVNSVSKDTANAVNQQKEAILEIARNIEEASAGTKQISRSVVDISHVAGETGHSAEQVLGAVKELAKQSTSLNLSVEGFLSDIKTAA